MAGSMACPLGGFVGSLFGLLLGRHCSTENALANASLLVLNRLTVRINRKGVNVFMVVVDYSSYFACCGDDLNCWLSGRVELGVAIEPICLKFTFLKPEVAEFHSVA